MAGKQLDGLSVAILATQDFEEAELMEPRPRYRTKAPQHASSRRKAAKFRR